MAVVTELMSLALMDGMKGRGHVHEFLSYFSQARSEGSRIWKMD